MESYGIQGDVSNLGNPCFFLQVPTSWEVVGLKSASGLFWKNASGNTRMIDDLK